MVRIYHEPCSEKGSHKSENPKGGNTERGIGKNKKKRIGVKETEWGARVGMAMKRKKLRDEAEIDGWIDGWMDGQINKGKSRHQDHNWWSILYLQINFQLTFAFYPPHIVNMYQLQSCTDTQTILQYFKYTDDRSVKYPPFCTTRKVLAFLLQ